MESANKNGLANWDIGIALMLSAASALIYESGATQVLFFYFTESSYSLATVLGVFLGGLGIGSFIFYRLSDFIKDKKMLFGMLQVITAIYAFTILTRLLSIIPQISPLGVFLVSSVILIIPAIFFGAIFPLAASLFKKTDRETVGLVYSVDLLGSIIGAFAVGFFVIPTLGITFAMGLGAILNLVSALLVLPKPQRIIPAILMGFILILVSSNHFLNKGGVLPPTKVVDGKAYQFYQNSPYGPVAVTGNSLFIRERKQCSFNSSPEAGQNTIVTYALEPLKIRHNSLDILNIGLGCGGTLGKILEYPNSHADVAEINPVVVTANRQFSNVLENARANLIVDDGLHYLRNTNKKYHSIIVIIDNPRVIESTPLYTVEAFKTESDALTNDGTFVLWSFDYDSNSGTKPLKPTPVRYRDILYYSLKEVFPYVYKYPEIFLASKQKLAGAEYRPQGPYEINTLDKNILPAAYLDETE